MADCRRFWPGNRNFPNIARTAMPIRKRKTILRITSHSKAREFRAFLNSSQDILCHIGAHAAPERPFRAVAAELDLVAKALFQHRLQVANPVDQPQFLRP